MIKMEEGRTRRLFSAEELAILEANWLTVTTPAELLALLPKRSMGTLIGRARLMGLPSRKFVGALHEPAPVSISEAAFVRKIRALGGYPYLLWVKDLGHVVVWPFERAA